MRLNSFRQVKVKLHLYIVFNGRFMTPGEVLISAFLDFILYFAIRKN